MLSVSSAWKEAHKQYVLPETFVEVSCEVIDVDAQNTADITGTNESVLSDVSHVRSNDEGSFLDLPAVKHFTLERNSWFLDGSTRLFFTDDWSWEECYSNDPGLDASVTFSISEVRDTVIPGLTITWSTLYGEYATKFSVIAKNGDTEVANVYVENNNSVTSVVEHEFSGYDSITVTVHEWCLPDHRARIERILLGHVLTFNKGDLLRFSHEQSGDINSAEIPKKSIEFSLNNVDGRWNPNNPAGMEKYLSERQRVTVRYGMDVNGTTEWINVGTFYLSEWKAPSNGMEATFAARDVFEYLMNTPYTGEKTDTLDKLVYNAMECGGIPGVTWWRGDVGGMFDYTATVEGNRTCAEVIQMCANAGGCVIIPARERKIDNGGIEIHKLNQVISDYVITLFASFAYPEIELSKQLKSVSVSYGENQAYVLNVGDTGETQTVDNPLIATEEQAMMIAEWVGKTLSTRKTISGSFRADPCLELYDIVQVESKYGTICPVAITRIKYTYTGAFTAEFTGKVITAPAARLGSMILGVSALGQEV